MNYKRKYLNHHKIGRLNASEYKALIYLMDKNILIDITRLCKQHKPDFVTVDGKSEYEIKRLKIRGCEYEIGFTEYQWNHFSDNVNILIFEPFNTKPRVECLMKDIRQDKIKEIKIIYLVKKDGKIIYIKRKKKVLCPSVWVPCASQKKLNVFFLGEFSALSFHFSASSSPHVVLFFSQLANEITFFSLFKSGGCLIPPSLYNTLQNNTPQYSTQPYWTQLYATLP